MHDNHDDDDDDDDDFLFVFSRVFRAQRVGDPAAQRSRRERDERQVGHAGGWRKTGSQARFGR